MFVFFRGMSFIFEKKKKKKKKKQSDSLDDFAREVVW